jgi:glycosyltransferase involved in cell wall biosynthesis
MTHLLIISHDVVDTRMAGPGIRYWEMARALAGRLDVTLAYPIPVKDTVAGAKSISGPPEAGFTSHAYRREDWASIAPIISRADVVLLTGDLFLDYPHLTDLGKPLVIEATYPYTFESLQLHGSMPRERQVASFATRREAMRRALLAGDFFFCANERQRDYWLGALDAFGRINPDTYAADPELYQLIDIIPFGLPSRRPEHTALAIKGVIPGIEATDRVVLWGGGLWQWLDSLSMVQAIARVSEEHPEVRLVFPATRHPNPAIPDMPMRQRTAELSDHLGLTNEVVFFGDWVPYESWPNYLLEADIGTSLHFEALETHFAFRTRMLDYIWAGLPMVVTGGDTTSELVARYGLGEVVSPGDVEAITEAIVRMLDTADLREAYRGRFDQVRPQFTWERVCEPIARFCAQPHLAPDRAAGALPPEVGTDKAVDALIANQDAEIARLSSLVEGYEQGRFIRLMKWLHSLR